MMKYEFWKDLRWELYAKKMWEFTDAVKKSIWNDKLEDTVIASYLIPPFGGGSILLTNNSV